MAKVYRKGWKLYTPTYNLEIGNHNAHLYEKPYASTCEKPETWTEIIVGDSFIVGAKLEMDKIP